MYGCTCLLELYMLLSLPPKAQLDILYSVPTTYCGAAPMMHIRSPLKKAGPESGTIFGSQIQATKSEAPLLRKAAAGELEMLLKELVGKPT